MGCLILVTFSLTQYRQHQSCQEEVEKIANCYAQTYSFTAFLGCLLKDIYQK